MLLNNLPVTVKMSSSSLHNLRIGSALESDGKLQAHLDKICQSSPSPIDVKIDLLPLELTSPDSIECFAQHVLSHVVSAFKKIDHMVLNAGIFLRNPQQAVQLRWQGIREYLFRQYTESIIAPEAFVTRNGG